MAPADLRGRRVLLFDGPGEWRDRIETQLREAGITPVICTDTVDAIREIDGHEVAAVVTDLHVGGDTESVTRLLLSLTRRQPKRAPKLIITSDLLDERIVSALRGMVSAFESKSKALSMPHLLATVLSPECEDD